ncbi:Amidase [Parvibaculum lavamentivorans DS-1]|uniref:Amidase n=1 Tax=Parvibaculum lavamentivorans (strain DS-1 / DSM 13023 / NCIMB 13966) TaxID=402881 RepID=A7HSP4_PARL1|nr:amidase family protein [Parvibaculum lavamentivorans]ABS62927.1 Amidase [Parvibaculum lavamentivorans DS-1]
MDFGNMTARALGDLFERGEADPRDATEDFLARAAAADPDHRIYVRLLEKRARAEAAAAADRAKRGLRRHALDGVPLSWKDLFDTAGAATAAGSLPLKDRVPARDAEVLARATRAGAVCLGKTTMTEIAFSGLGINPKFGTPANACDEKIERVPGGSSAGAAVSVARDLAAGAIGTDTGGSVRIPAAWNGLVGLKTTSGSLPLTGTVPLSPTFDTVGPLAKDVEDAAAMFALLEGKQARAIEPFDLSRAVFMLPGGIGWSELEEGVAAALEGAIRRLVHAGARIVEHPLPELDEVHRLAWDPKGSRLVADAYAQWGEMLQANANDIYQPVRDRVMAGERLMAGDIIRADMERADIRARYLAATAGADAVLMPTVAISPPPIAALIDGGEAYGKANRMALRNTTMGNQLGLCAMTLPAGYDGQGLPVGLMLQAAPFTEEKLLRVGRAVEKALH